tara:strand:- start:425 stop:613 length:189 start_codon:yes stop_codon:yes gene_type:complete
MTLFGWKFRSRIRHKNSYQIRDGVRVDNPSFLYTGKTVDKSGIVGRRLDIGRAYFHVANYGR